MEMETMMKIAGVMPPGEKTEKELSTRGAPEQWRTKRGGGYPSLTNPRARDVDPRRIAAGRPLGRVDLGRISGLSDGSRKEEEPIIQG
ncbi:unnamed protein product [Linum trigynum]|uniref:Uncharacterized protein n=1 Tax=Linum trigynum TaxID=586398 RepID=A0AAV2E1C7_9ROSI